MGVANCEQDWQGVAVYGLLMLQGGVEGNSWTIY